MLLVRNMGNFYHTTIYSPAYLFIVAILQKHPREFGEINMK